MMRCGICNIIQPEDRFFTNAGLHAKGCTLRLPNYEDWKGWEEEMEKI